MSANQKIALVTGANKGLGLEIAKNLAQKGIKVILGSRNLEKGKAAVSGLKAQGWDVEALSVDLSDSRSLQAAARYISGTYGKLDILVNNAGIAEPGAVWGKNSAVSVTDANLKETFQTNFFGQVELTQALLPLLQKSAAGRIVNQSSILGSQVLHADPKSPIYDSKNFAYNASKTALNSFTIHLAHALKGTRVKVNSAHPGWVKTDLGTSAAPMEISDGAKTATDLALLPDDGPTGAYFHLGQVLPW